MPISLPADPSRDDALDVRALSGDFDVVYGGLWFRDWFAHFPHGIEVCIQGALKVVARLSFVLARRGAAWQAIPRMSPRNWGRVTFSSMV
jgi:hypothetical protein